MTNHPIADAFPDGATSADAIRQNLSMAFPLVLEAADDIQDMDLTGLLVREVRVNGVAFLYDAADETSAHDGVTTLVSQNGYRFIAEISAGAFVSVLSIADSPPLSPVVGDKHIIGVAPSGDFADHADDFAVLTSRGWEFASPEIGQKVRVIDAQEFRFWSEAGDWAQDGVADGSVQARHLQFPFGMAVESELATPPGGTPAAGTKWIVAANALLAWDDWDGDIAEADGAGGFRRLSAYHGATVYDRALNVSRSFNSGTGTWQAAGGAWVAFTTVFEENGGASFVGSGFYTYSNVTAPANNRRTVIDEIDHQARHAGALLRIRFEADIYEASQGDSGGALGDHVVAVYRDSETNAIDWARIAAPGELSVLSAAIHKSFTFVFAASDAGGHTYKLAITEARTSEGVIKRPRAARSRITLEEAA